jgi:hypothetical protein
MGGNLRVRPLTIALLGVSTVLAAVGIIYLMVNAGDLPTWFPAYRAGAEHVHPKHGFAMLAGAALGLAAAFFSTLPDQPDGP